MDLGDFETTVKVIVVGNGGVGKSSMTARYCKGTYTDTYKKTIGVDFLEKSIDAGNGESVKLMIWDTAGQEEFDALTATYYRGAGACAIVFSSTDRASFDAVEKWKRKVEDECGGVIMALVQNKCDLIDKAVVTPAEVEAMARKLGVKLYRTSVKEDLNVKEVFEYLASQYIVRGGDTSGVSAMASIGDYHKSGSSSALAAGSGAAAQAEQPEQQQAPQSNAADSRAPATAASDSKGDDDARQRDSQSDRTAARVEADGKEDDGAAAASNAAAAQQQQAPPAPAPVPAPAPAAAANSGKIKLGAETKEQQRKKKNAFSFC